MLGDRGDKSRSSFGMILKDKFQKNPNMYFPDTGTDAVRTNSKTSEFVEPPRKGSSNTKIPDNLSDTDTLIHNMSEGSFEKDSSLSGRDGSQIFGILIVLGLGHWMIIN